jgi:hypothetical protein
MVFQRLQTYPQQSLSSLSPAAPYNKERTDFVKASFLMAKAKQQPTYDQVLSILGNEHFDVSPAGEGANRAAGARRVSKYGIAAELAEGPGKQSPVRMLAKPGFVLGGEISLILDRGYQKFLKTSRLEIPATADHLRDIHKFTEELKEATGAQELYNEALGTTSNEYVYDRVKGRE